MKTLKIIDITISVGLIIGFTISYLIHDNDAEIMIMAYLITGAWQVISMIAHAFRKEFFRKGSTRVAYSFISLLLLVTMPLGSIWILALAAWPMAICYTVLCYIELKRI